MRPRRRPRIWLQDARRAVFTGGTNPGPGQTACPPSYRTLRVAPPGSAQGIVISAWLPGLDAYLPACTQVYVTPVVPSADLRAP
jgi:hypothetical protein